MQTRKEQMISCGDTGSKPLVTPSDGEISLGLLYEECVDRVLFQYLSLLFVVDMVTDTCA